MFAWQLEWGDKIDTLLDFEASSGITPKALQTRPQLPGHLFWYYESFRELQRDRSYEQGHPMPLTTGQIRAYFDAFELVDFHEFYDTMVLIDRAYMSELEKRNASKEKTHKQSAPVPTKTVRRG